MQLSTSCCALCDYALDGVWGILHVKYQRSRLAFAGTRSHTRAMLMEDGCNIKLFMMKNSMCVMMYAR